jgi:hypothetical protein
VSFSFKKCIIFANIGCWIFARYEGRGGVKM